MSSILVKTRVLLSIVLTLVSIEARALGKAKLPVGFSSKPPVKFIRPEKSEIVDPRYIHLGEIKLEPEGFYSDPNVPIYAQAKAIVVEKTENVNGQDQKVVEISGYFNIRGEKEAFTPYSGETILREMIEKLKEENIEVNRIHEVWVYGFGTAVNYTRFLRGYQKKVSELIASGEVSLENPSELPAELSEALRSKLMAAIINGVNFTWTAHHIRKEGFEQIGKIQIHSHDYSPKFPSIRTYFGKGKSESPPEITIDDISLRHLHQTAMNWRESKKY